MIKLLISMLFIVNIINASQSEYEYNRANAASAQALDDLDCDFGDCPKPKPKPKVIIKEKIVEKPVIKEKVIIKEKIVEKPVEKIIYRDRPQEKVTVNESGVYSSCSQIKASNPNSESGDYELNIDGRKYNTYCEMKLEGGGWTRVWVAQSPDYKQQIFDYDLPYSFIESSTRTMISFDKNGRQLSPYSFETPQDWKVQHPMSYAAKVVDINTFDVYTNKEYRNRRLYFGYQNFSSKCEHPFKGGKWGKVCITDTQAPFYASFNHSQNDYCNDSKQNYNTIFCEEKRFSIFMK